MGGSRLVLGGRGVRVPRVWCPVCRRYVMCCCFLLVIFMMHSRLIIIFIVCLSFSLMQHSITHSGATARPTRRIHILRNQGRNTHQTTPRRSRSRRQRKGTSALHCRRRRQQFRRRIHTQIRRSTPRHRGRDRIHAGQCLRSRTGRR